MIQFLKRLWFPFFSLKVFFEIVKEIYQKARGHQKPIKLWLKRDFLNKNILITLRALDQFFQTYRHIMLNIKHFFHLMHKTKFPSRGGEKILNLTKVLQFKKVENLCCREKKRSKDFFKKYFWEKLCWDKKKNLVW